MFILLCILHFEVSRLLDVSNSDVLQDISKNVGWNVNVEEIIQKPENKTLLKDNTEEALDHGAFGVPRCANILCYVY